MVYLDVSVDADSGVIDTLQTFKSNWTLLLIIDEEDYNPACKVKEDSDCRTFTDATVCPAWSHREE